MEGKNEFYYQISEIPWEFYQSLRNLIRQPAGTGKPRAKMALHCPIAERGSGTRDPGLLGQSRPLAQVQGRKKKNPP